jgi:hypothetical protein
MLLSLQRNGVNVVKDVGCVLDDASAAHSNLTKINSEIAKTWNSTLHDTPEAARYALILPAGQLFIDGSITIPKKTSLAIIGQGGLAYRLGDSSYSPAGIGGRVSRITDLAADGSPIIEEKGYGLVLEGVCLTGRYIPTSDNSGTGTRCSGIKIDGDETPQTGGVAAHNIVFADCDPCVTFSGTPNENHADTCTFDHFLAQGFDTFCENNNLQAVGNAFRDGVFLGNDSCVLFHNGRGGCLDVENCQINSPSVTIYKPGSYYSQNNNQVVFKSCRWDTPQSPPGHLTLVDYGETNSDTFDYRVRFEDFLIAGFPSTSAGGWADRDFDPRDLVKSPTNKDGGLFIDYIVGTYQASGNTVISQIEKYRPLSSVNYQRLPTSDPHVVGQAYLSSGTLMFSSG